MGFSTSAPDQRWSGVRRFEYTSNMDTKLPIAEMTKAYQESDATYNGLFFLGVRTTGIFCRPTCSARKPLPKNVEFFSTIQSALASGYRPCKRCRPMAVDDQPAWVADLLSEIE